jgi:hypothetical protein
VDGVERRLPLERIRRDATVVDGRAEQLEAMWRKREVGRLRGREPGARPILRDLDQVLERANARLHAAHP